jgi:hypothetical protein
MDAETTRLLISTGVAFASGVIGAVIAAVSTHFSSKRANHHQREMLSLEKNHDRLDALRSRKEDDYRNLLLGLDAYQTYITKAYTAEPRQWDTQQATEAEANFRAAAAHVTLFTDDTQLQEALEAASAELASVARAAERSATMLEIFPGVTEEVFPARMDVHRRQILTAMRHDLRMTAAFTQATR